MAGNPLKNPFGLLPEGVQDFTLTQAKARFVTSFHRQKQWDSFLDLYEQIGDGFSHLYLTGDFVGGKERTPFIDVALETRDAFGSAALAAMEPFFTVGLGRIQREYGVRLHFWCRHLPAALVSLGVRMAWVPDLRQTVVRIPILPSPRITF